MVALKLLRLLMQLSKSPVPPDHTDVEHQNQLRDSVLKTLEDYWCECCVGMTVIVVSTPVILGQCWRRRWILRKRNSGSRFRGKISSAFADLIANCNACNEQSSFRSQLRSE